MPRYIARWSNGYWKTFDRANFADVDKHPTERLAKDAAAALNTARRH